MLKRPLTPEDKILLAQIIKTTTIIGVMSVSYYETKKFGTEIVMPLVKDMLGIP